MTTKLGGISTPFDDHCVDPPAGGGEGALRKGGTPLDQPGAGLHSGAGIAPSFAMPTGGAATPNSESGLENAPELYQLPDAPAPDTTIPIPDVIDPTKVIDKR